MDASAPRILKAADGVAMGDPAGVRDRFMVDGADAGGRFALVQHLFPPRALAAPLHRHHREDEYTYVLYGRIGAVLGDDEVVAEPGDLVFKPRDQWHTFWNAGDEPAAVLELISPRGAGAVLPLAGRAHGTADGRTARRDGRAVRVRRRPGRDAAHR